MRALGVQRQGAKRCCEGAADQLDIGDEQERDEQGGNVGEETHQAVSAVEEKKLHTVGTAVQKAYDCDCFSLRKKRIWA